MKRALELLGASLLVATLTACGSSQPPAPGGGASDSRTGVSYDHVLASDVDGEPIAFTVHEPDTVAKGQSYPLVLDSHGYGGRRVLARPTAGFLARLLANGYGVLSLDERGHGAFTDGSGGTIRILDPEFEGKDWLQVLDWTEENLDWMEFRGGNPVIGGYGGSYGGGYQHLIYRIDPKKRLDAITPAVTWHDLRYSLLPGGVFKTFWTTAVGAIGNSPGNNVDPLVNQGLAQGASTNEFPPEFTELLYNVSMVSNCEGARLQDPPMTPIAALYIQSVIDQLFNFNEGYRNYECASRLGGDVRLFLEPNGHVGGPHQRCGSIDMNDATFAFFEEHLKRVAGAADFVPKICYQLDNVDPEGTDGIMVDSVLVGGTAAPEVSASGLILQTGSNEITNLPLITLNDANDPEGDGDILAGIPTIELTIANPDPLGAGPEPILFVGLSRSTDGGETWTLLHGQLMPFRGYGDFSTELVGVLERFKHGDAVGLSIYSGSYDQFGSSGSKPAAVADVTARVRLPLIGTAHPVPGP